MEYIRIIIALLLIALIWKGVATFIKILRLLPWQVVVFGFVAVAFLVLPGSKHGITWYIIILIGYVVSMMKTYINNHR